MSYRNKTYVIFDGDNDLWGWNENKYIEFAFPSSTQSKEC